MNAFLKLGVGTAILTSSLVSVPGFEGTPLGVSAAHAEHRDYRRYNRRDRFDVGDAVIGAVVVGGLIAILSGASKKKRQDENRPLDSGWKPGGDWDRQDDTRWQDRDWDNRTNEERAAITSCAREAESVGSRYGREARVREIGDVDREGGEYRVKGSVDIRGEDRDNRDDREDRAARDNRSSDEFICYVRNDRITDFRFEAGYAAR